MVLKVHLWNQWFQWAFVLGSDAAKSVHWKHFDIVFHSCVLLQLGSEPQNRCRKKPLEGGESSQLCTGFCQLVKSTGWEIQSSRPSPPSGLKRSCVRDLNCNKVIQSLWLVDGKFFLKCNNTAKGSNETQRFWINCREFSRIRVDRNKPLGLACKL